MKIMDADIEGCLNQINNSWKAFEHKGKPMTKKQVKTVLEYGLKKGYETTNEIPENEIDQILENLKKWDKLEKGKPDQHLIKW